MSRNQVYIKWALTAQNLTCVLYFAKFEWMLKGFTANVQVVGICNDDTYMCVIEKAANCLGVSTDAKITLVCSWGDCE